MEEAPQRRRPRVRLRLLVLLSIAALCGLVVLDLVLDIDALDAVRPRSGLSEPPSEGGGADEADPEDGVDPTSPAPEEERARVREEARRWWRARLDEERDGFVAKRGLDATRPRAGTPVRWRYLTFGEARAAAAREAKPLFVDVGALWSPWCHRMDYYTYPDAEVTKLLNERFVPVKILQEQDRGDDYLRLRSELGADGVPALGVWSADGKLLASLGGWTRPEALVERLEEVLRKKAGTRAPR